MLLIMSVLQAVAKRSVCPLAAEQVETVDTQGGNRLDIWQYADCNWMQKYGERYKLIFYGVPE